MKERLFHPIGLFSAFAEYGIQGSSFKVEPAIIAPA